MKSTKQYASDPFDNSTIETGDALIINNMKEEKKKRLEEIITTTNMAHNRRKACKTIRDLSNNLASYTPYTCLVSANHVVHQLLINSRGTMSTKPKPTALPPTTDVEESMVQNRHRCFEEQQYCWNRWCTC